MPAHRKALIVAIVAIATALVAALAFESRYPVSIRTRLSDPLISLTKATEARTAPGQSAFTLRLVDSGGVGIPLNGEWGTDYSHDRRVFRDVILDAPPYVDAAAFQRVDQEWRAYVERMLDYGNNAIAVPMLLELIDFDRATLQEGSRGASASARGVLPIYAAESPFRARHAAVRRHFGPLFEWADRRGMQVFLDMDMLMLTPPLAQYLRSLAPDGSALGIDSSDPAVWAVYRAGLEELFDNMSSIKGVVIRFGEGGDLYNTAGWPYRSEMAVRTAEHLRAMLRGLLPVFEARGKTLMLRSWTVGVGQLGRLHVDPRVYDAVLGDIDSPALVVSTKFTAGDFFSYLPLNPTLAGGRHRRLVELQAKPEFEGFGAFPDFLGHEYARALRVLRATNPRIVGTYVLSQAGGPLRAGPRTLYPFHGFWLWTDANVFVASRLAVEPGADVNALARRWAETRFGSDARIVDAITHALAQTRAAVLEGFYIRPFAEREVRLLKLELPPLMWIFEWDMVGGWHSLLSLVYQGSREDVNLAIEEGHAAATRVRSVRQQVQAAFAAAGPSVCAHICDETLRSLEYQETLFDTLAAWRQTFLSYYRWLDTGDPGAWTQWRNGRTRFDRAAAQHVARFGHDPEFPALDLRSAIQAVSVAEREPWSRRLAAATLIVVAALLSIGSPFGQRSRGIARLGALARVGRLMWISAMTPWRLDREPLNQGSAGAATLLVLVLIGVFVGTLTGFAAPKMSAGLSLLCGVFAIAFESTATGVPWRGRGRLLAAALGPLIPGLIILWALIAWVGPLGFWYRLWIVPIFRIAILTTLLAMMLWTAYVMLAVRALDDWHARIGGLLVAVGAGLVALTALLPDWVHVLRFLERPLNLAPATGTIVFALQTYARVSLGPGRVSWVLGTSLLAGGYALAWHAAVVRNRLRADVQS